MNNKRGVSEPAGDIAALILLILLSIIIYIVLIPPAEREKLLNDDENQTGDNIYGSILLEETLLSASPGKVHPVLKDEVTKEINSVSLFTNREEKVTSIATALIVSKSLFSEETKQLSFGIDDIGNLDSAKLFFFITEAKGEIFIELNGNTIYEGKLDSSNIPIMLPVSTLRANNILRIGAKGRLWNKFALAEINVKSTYTYENKLVKRNFELSSREKASIEKASFEYYINCMGREEGILSIMLNNRLLSDDYVACDAGKRTLEINPSNLIAGTNVLEFRAGEGNYDIQGLELNLDMKEKVFPTYNFEVTDETYKQVFDSCYIECEADCGIDCTGNNDCYNDCLDDCDEDCSRANVIVMFDFGGSGEVRKKAAITINEFELNMNTQAPEYTRVISDYIRRGDNSIKIIPKTSFDIDSLLVFVD